MFVGIADSIMVASVGEAAVSGVSLVDNIRILFINALLLLLQVETVCGQYLGQKNEKESCKAATLR